MQSRCERFRTVPRERLLKAQRGQESLEGRPQQEHWPAAGRGPRVAQRKRVAAEEVGTQSGVGGRGSEATSSNVSASWGVLPQTPNSEPAPVRTPRSLSQSGRNGRIISLTLWE